MTNRSPREHRIPVLALALLCVLPIAGVRAQSPRAAESSAVLPGARVSSTTIGASVAVIDSAEIAASGARTLSELLMARVPGLSVRRRGGTEADGSAVYARGPAYGATPMLVVDGIVVAGDQAVPVPGTSVAISRLDDLTPADVQRIEVLRGPAAGALYGFGAAAGVIVVTTRRGGEGRVGLDVSAGTGLADVGTRFPANYQLTNGTPRQPCNPRVAPSPPTPCTPTTLYSWNPLDQASPFRTGRAASARAALSGTTFGTQLYAGVSAERVGGVTSDDRQSRLGLRASVERALPGHLTVSAQGSYLERDASVPSRGNSGTMDNVIASGLLGSAYDDSVRGYRMPFNVPTEIRLPEPSLTRVTSALRIGWQPLDWLTMEALGGQDRARQRALRVERYPFANETYDTREVEDARWTSGTMHLGTEARYGAGERLALATYLAYDDVRTRDRRLDSTGTTISNGPSSSSLTITDMRARVQEATIRQHVGWGGVLDLNAGTRWWVGRGVSAPLGVEASRNVDASWRLPALRPGLDLRLRAAAGRAPLVEPGTQLMVPGSSFFGQYTTQPLRSRRGESEGGIDATFGNRAQLQLTWFAAQTRDQIVGNGPLPSPIGLGLQPVMADVTNRGIEALVSAQLLDGPRLGWRTTLTAATLRNRVTEATFPLRSVNGSLATGYPLQGYWDYAYRWSDANGDGLVARNEVLLDTMATMSYVGPSTPTLEVGLRNSVTLGGGLTVGALLDYRGGQYRDNQTEAVRCLYDVCRGIQDPTLPLADQVRWVAVRKTLARDIEPASFLRLRELVLEWTAPVAVARAIGAERLAVRVIGQNLATWTRYSGLDPEVGAVSLDAWAPLVDSFQAPVPRRVLVELRAGGGIGRP